MPSISAAQDVAEERLDRIFAALGDRTRRALLKRLSAGPAMVTELAAPFAMSLPAVSKHLKVLEKAGLVRRSVKGRVHNCALDAAALRDAEAWIERTGAFWDGTLNSLAEFIEAEPHRRKKQSGAG